MSTKEQEYITFRRTRVDKRITRLGEQDKLDIIKAYEEDIEPMMSIAIKYNKSRQAIWKLLKKAGVNTVKKGMAVSCTTCKAVIYRPKSQIRNRQNHFCNMKCYQAFLDAGASHLTPTEQRRGNRRARVIVAKHFSLQLEHIVHHEDQNPLNNQLCNLRVFANQGDHIRYHHKLRDFEHDNKNSSIIIIEPLWDGSKY